MPFFDLKREHWLNELPDLRSILIDYTDILYHMIKNNRNVK